MGNKKNWTREETILAMDLYTRIPFGKIGKTHPLIIELAQLIGRTPDAVALKMSNLAHFDPKLQERNVVGMAHGSKLDSIIYYEFSNNIEELSFQAQSITASYKNISLEELLPELEIDNLPPGEYKEIQTKARVGQYFFRLAILSSYNNSCCITGMKGKELLVASHIKPWSECDVLTERTNPCNGLCLNAFHDRAFDKGLITIDNKYRIICSKYLKEIEMDAETRDWISFYNEKKIIMPDKYLPGKHFIEYHNDVVFLGA